MDKKEVRTLEVAPGEEDSRLDRWLKRRLNAEEDPGDLVLRYLAAFGPASAADVQTWSGLQGIKTVLGGPHVTLAPQDAQPHADSIVVGYAEDAWPQLECLH